MEKDRKCTPHKMTEKLQLENERIEYSYLENGRNITPRKLQKKKTPKMIE